MSQQDTKFIKNLAVTNAKIANTTIDLTTKVTGILPTANGGTGSTALSTGVVRSASGTLSAAELSGDVTTSGSNATTIAALAVTNSKIANTTIDLTTKVTGTLPVANGGTGAATLTANNVLLGNGTSALQVVAPGTLGNILTSTGTTWQSQAPGALSFINPSTQWQVYEEFTSSSNTTTGSPFVPGASGTGAAVTANSFFSNSDNEVGTFIFASGTAANSRSYCATSPSFVENAGWELTFEARATSDATDATNPFVVLLGFGTAVNNAQADYTDGAYFLFNANGTRTTWDAVTANNSTRTTTNTGTTVDLTTMQTLKITLNTTEAKFYINGSLVVTTTTNLPGNNRFFGVSHKIIKIGAGGGGNTNCYVDYMLANGTLSGGR